MSTPEPRSEIDEYVHRLGLLHELGQELGRAIDEGVFFRTTAVFIRRILPRIDRASVTLVTPDGAHLELFALDAAAPELASAFPVGVRLAIEGSLIGLVIRGQRSLALEGEAFARSELADIAVLRGLGLRSSMDAPLVVGGTAIGTVNTASSAPAPYGSRDGELLERIASLMAAHLERFRLTGQLRGALDVAHRNAAQMEREARVLRAIVEGTAGETGEGFLQSLVRHLAAALGVRWACLSEPIAPTKARTIVFWDADRFLPATDYDLVGAPCGEALSGRICYQPRGVRERFPDGALMRELGVEAYVGVPLFDAAGVVFGDLVVMDDRPLDEDGEDGEDGARSLRVIRIFAARAQAELLRLRAESERTRLLTELRRTTALIETTTDFACLVSLTGEVLYINPAGMQLVGHEGEDPTRFRASDIVAGEHSPSFAKVLEVVRAQGSWSGERYFRHRNGQIIPVDQVVTLIRDEAGEPICTGSIARDVSEHRRTLGELEEARRDAEAANRAKSAFLAKMSHELRTPLGAILGFAQLLGRELDLSSPHQEYLRIIRKSGEHLLALINDTLEVSRIEAGRITLHPEVFDLRELFAGVEAMLRLRAEEKGLALRVELHPELPRSIRTDAAKLRQVLLNLLGNAIKFTERGEVALRAASSPATGDGRGVRLHVEVEDTGPGIDAREQGALFDAFYQAEAGRRSHEGTGLGLQISRQFVHLLGGSIDLESRLGHGSRFRFDVLVELAEGVATASGLHRMLRVVGLAEDQAEVRVLVAEDRRENRMLLCRLLGAVGFTVFEAANGEEAVEHWARHAPHLIWMDMAMPVMDGWEATRQIRAAERPGAARTVIIALTASAFEGEREAVLAAGCDDFMTKPFEEQELLEKMAQRLGVRYRYESDAPAPVPACDEPTPEQLGAIEAGLVSSLRNAAVQLDPEQTILVIEQIRASAPRLADGLHALVRRFEFDRLLELTAGR